MTLEAKNAGYNKALFMESPLRTAGLAVGWAYATYTDSCGVIPNSLTRKVLPTFKFEVNVCWQVATKDVPTLMMFWDGSLIGEEDVWFWLREDGMDLSGQPSEPRPTRSPEPTRIPPTPRVSTGDFCSLENFARINSRYTRALERGDYSRASEIGIELGRWIDQCQ